MDNMNKAFEDKDRPSNLISLQMLRAIAAISVVYLHIVHPYPNLFPIFGKFGVDIFFVISGFVMALVISKGQSSSIFAISRISRIIPLYWMLTILVFLLALIKPSLLASTHADVTHLILSLFFIPHFREFGTLHPILAVGWTLNYEMFFYFCTWISILFVRRYYFFINISLIALTYFFLGIQADNKVLNTFFGNSYLFEFVLGMLCFKFYTLQFFNKLHKVILIALPIICCWFMAYSEVNLYDLDRIFLYGIPSALLLLSLTSLESTSEIKNNFISRGFSSIGDASYAIYLSHLYVVEGLRRVLLNSFHIENFYTNGGVFLVIFVVLVVGHFIYIYIDKPISTKLKKYMQEKMLSSNANENKH